MAAAALDFLFLLLGALVGSGVVYLATLPQALGKPIALGLFIVWIVAFATLATFAPQIMDNLRTQLTFSSTPIQSFGNGVILGFGVGTLHAVSVKYLGMSELSWRKIRASITEGRRRESSADPQTRQRNVLIGVLVVGTLIAIIAVVITFLVVLSLIATYLMD